MKKNIKLTESETGGIMNSLSDMITNVIDKDFLGFKDNFKSVFQSKTEDNDFYKDTTNDSTYYSDLSKELSNFVGYEQEPEAITVDVDTVEVEKTEDEEI